jgi:anti-sigma factor RsiW
MTACTAPLSAELLADFFAGELSREESDRLEEHVFACERCALEFELAGALAGGLRALVPPVITHAKLDSLRRAGLSLHVTPVEPEVPVTVRFAPGIELLVHALRADFTGAERIDVELLDRQGQRMIELAGVPVDRDRGEVLVACQRHYEEGFSDLDCFRIWSVQGRARRAVGDYKIAHIWR